MQLKYIRPIRKPYLTLNDLSSIHVSKAIGLKTTDFVYSKFYIRSVAGYAPVNSVNDWNQIIRDFVRFCSTPIKIRDIVFSDGMDLPIVFYAGDDIPLSEYAVVFS